MKRKESNLVDNDRAIYDSQKHSFVCDFMTVGTGNLSAYKTYFKVHVNSHCNLRVSEP